MQDLGLHIAVHKDTLKLDTAVLKWAYAAGILVSPGEVEAYHKEKINFFAGYLYPTISPEQLEWIMRLFLWLFVVDDRLDREDLTISVDFVTRLKAGLAPAEGSPFLPLHLSLQALSASSPGKDQPEWGKGWTLHWSDFVEGLEWELDNKIHERDPELADYRFYRPHISGVYLALHFLKLNHDFSSSCTTVLLEYKVARWICLSNDLISSRKEERIGDLHNELVLMSKIVPARDARAYLETECNVLLRHIRQLQADILVEAPVCRDWLSALNLLLGGCAYWSNEVTVRYESYVNGVNQA